MWIRGGEGEMTAERRATHTHDGISGVGAVFVYSIRTCAEFNCACVLLRAKATVPVQSSQSFKVRLCELYIFFKFAQSICYVHSIIINFIPGILEAKNDDTKIQG